jgi:hypothetical protein
MRKISVQMITAKGCIRCEEVKQRLAGIATSLGVNLDIKYIDSSTNEAVLVGIKYLLDDVPSFVIEGKSFCGTEFLDNDVIKLIRKIL